VVPLLEKYDFENVIRILLTAKEHLPSNRPIHLFGAGHPLFFAVAVFLGVDMFDSAAYILYANKNRYITEFGTENLENMQYFPCSCITCRNYSPEELRRIDPETRVKLLATHNLIVSFEEIRRIKQAIVEGRLRELVLSRVMSHPSLARSLNLLFGQTTSHFIEPYELISKPRALFISHPIQRFHPLIQRYKNRILERFYSWSPNLVIAQDYQKIRSTRSYQVVKLSPLFGIIPDELRGVYPLVQHERIPMTYVSDQIDFIANFIKKFHSNFQNIEVHSEIKLDIDLFKKFNIFEQSKRPNKMDDIHKLNAIVNYQFGENTHKILLGNSLSIERSRKTGILRRFSDDSGLLGTFRPADFHIIPTETFANLLHSNLPYPRLRVVASSDSVPFIVQKKDLLAKFVEKVDPEIRCGEEVLIIDKTDRFLNFGKSILSAFEMIDFDRGVAVRGRS
jgi:7-cyano-7-deazaguanine tRNA-ribosyltransferase